MCGGGAERGGDDVAAVDVFGFVVVEAVDVGLGGIDAAFLMPGGTLMVLLLPLTADVAGNDDANVLGITADDEGAAAFFVIEADDAIAAEEVAFDAFKVALLATAAAAAEAFSFFDFATPTVSLEDDVNSLFATTAAAGGGGLLLFFLPSMISLSRPAGGGLPCCDFD